MPTKRQKLIAAGKCVNYFRCGNERGDDGTETMCRPCATEKSGRYEPKRRGRRRRRSRRGLCTECTKATPAARGKKLCMTHLVMAAQAAQRYRDRMKKGETDKS